MNNTKGFTLIELMIVVAIVGILAAIAVPMYRSQQIKSRMTEGTRGVSTVASALGDFLQDNATWPGACGDVTAIDNTLGVGVSTSRYISAMSTDASGNITVVFQNTGDTDVDNAANSLVLQPTLNANGSVDWNWASNGIPAKFVPSE
jgi:prepilin-type N-terminal cleavage/methylation domain-containing protein